MDAAPAAAAAAAADEALQIPDVSIVTAGETSDDDPMPQGPTQSPDDEDDETLRYTHPDELFDDQADDQDEAYVYKNLRSGVQETVTVQRPQRKEQMQVYKPRDSDAVLSCPCCFNIVCMDCQRHERYSDQYRAMFVMGITVQWDRRLVYSDAAKALVPDNRKVDQGQVPPDHTVYYQVSCGNCETVVAALDMADEVYHFYGCLASS